MKSLYLLRHGRAETKEKQPDIERNLDDEGRNEVRVTAEKMLKLGINPSLIIASNANRAYQTAEIVASTLGYNIKNIEIEKEIYHSGVDAMATVIENQDDKYQSILVAGHNPTISYLANSLDKSYKWTMETAELLAFELHANSWDTFMEHEIKLLFQIQK